MRLQIGRNPDLELRTTDRSGLIRRADTFSHTSMASSKSSPNRTQSENSGWKITDPPPDSMPNLPFAPPPADHPRVACVQHQAGMGGAQTIEHFVDDVIRRVHGFLQNRIL